MLFFCMGAVFRNYFLTLISRYVFCIQVGELVSSQCSGFCTYRIVKLFCMKQYVVHVKYCFMQSPL